MKYYSLAFLFLAAQICNGQDSTKHSCCSKNSISFTAGANFCYPTLTQYNFGYSNNILKPATGTEPWFSLSYNKLFRDKGHSSLGMTFGLSYVQYKYTGILTEFGDPAGPIAVEPALQEIHNVEVNAGAFVNEKICRRISWYSEISVLLSMQTYVMFTDVGPNASWGQPQGYYELINLTNEEPISLYLFYKTGVTINVCKHVSVTPLVAFPLMNITARSVGWNSFFDGQNFYNYSSNEMSIYNSMRTGIMVTYNLGGK